MSSPLRDAVCIQAAKSCDVLCFSKLRGIGELDDDFDAGETCPNNDKGGFLFVWGILFTLIYPVGILVLVLVLMWVYEIPAMARARCSDARVHALVLAMLRWQRDQGSRPMYYAYPPDPKHADVHSCSRPVFGFCTSP